MEKSEANNGQEVGKNLIKICKKLLDNQDLCKLLVNEDLDPLNNPDIEDTIELFNKQIRVVPLISSDEEDSTSKIVLIFSNGKPTNNLHNESLELQIYLYVPFDKWKITGEQLRPFSIMSEIRKSLSYRKINGLGEIDYKGFSLINLTEKMGCYEMEFLINAFN